MQATVLSATWRQCGLGELHSVKAGIPPENRSATVLLKMAADNTVLFIFCPHLCMMYKDYQQAACVFVGYSPGSFRHHCLNYTMRHLMLLFGNFMFSVYFNSHAQVKKMA